jgi:hypothetical protein
MKAKNCSKIKKRLKRRRETDESTSFFFSTQSYSLFMRYKGVCLFKNEQNACFPEKSGGSCTGLPAIPAHPRCNKTP